MQMRTFSSFEKPQSLHVIWESLHDTKQFYYNHYLYTSAIACLLPVHAIDDYWKRMFEPRKIYLTLIFLRYLWPHILHLLMLPSIALAIAHTISD